MLNSVSIMGRLGHDPELRYTQSGIAVTNFSIAVDRDFKDKTTGKRATDWIDVTAWRHTAEFVNQYFTKGRMAVVNGRLETQKWVDDDGRNRTKVIVIADSVYFGDSAKEDDADKHTSEDDGAAAGTFAPYAGNVSDLPF